MVANWKNIIISPNVSIREAWRVLDASGLRIVVAVDEDGILVGVATDGDIRRGLLKETGLEDPINDVLNTSPVTASTELSKEALVSLMEEHSLLAIPLVDRCKLVGVETLHGLLSVPRIDNPVFIMAGGFGTRLKPLTDNCPKPMLKVGNKPMLEIVIDGFKKSGFHNFYISTHFMPEIIRSYFGDGTAWDISITYVHEDMPLGTGGALGLLPDSLPQDLPVIVINGDVLTKTDFCRVLKFHNQSNADATMCVREYEYKIPYGVVNGECGNVLSMDEKPTKRFSVNAGIYVLSPELIASVSKNEKIDLPTLLEKNISKGKAIKMVPIHEYWLDIGRIEDFQRAQRDIYELGIQ